MGVFLRALLGFGILTNVVWPWFLACATYEMFVFHQKNVRYPKHGYAVNFLLCGGLKEELVIIVGFLIDILWEIMLDSMIVAFTFFSFHAGILSGRFLINRIF
uniref:Uncharacterized protein n=1 Tax=Acrobeloides nanus TaxID=290746 RepID=A0A914C2L5_9BILA